ncbi:MAG: DoxX family protein [Sphingobacteriales bacterium]|nr:MAG: DoxX family protein [Sphingobacteriales bacterium]
MKLQQTTNDKALAFARIVLGLVFFPHGAQKLLGWFGGYGFSGTMGYFTDTMHLPWLVAFLVILVEFLGSILLILGLATRITALAFTALTLGIIFTSHIEFGFFMNWFGDQKGEGYEFFLLVLALLLPLLLHGAGGLSLDWKISERKQPDTTFRL